MRSPCRSSSVHFGERTTASLTIPALASVQALHAECTLEPSTGHTDASAEISGATLLGGAIRLTDIETSCVATEAGLVGSSRVGTLNGQPIGTAPTTISIPLVATVYLNQTVNGPNGQLAQYSVRVVTLLGQEIILSGCRLGIDRLMWAVRPESGRAVHPGPSEVRADVDGAGLAWNRMASP